MASEFYVGYLKQAPPRMARRICLIAFGVLVVAGCVGALVAVFQNPLEAGAYEFGVFREFEGVLRESPIPNLLVDEPGGESRAFLLVGAGKQGVPGFAQGGIGMRVRFMGSLIYRQNMTMVEMNDEESFEILGDADRATPSETESLGPVALVGELVDTKCFFGVMRPGVGKVHRACASVCLKGGVPPGLLLRHDDGRSTVVMLSGGDGNPAAINPQWAAREIAVKGDLMIEDGIPVVSIQSIALNTN